MPWWWSWILAGVGVTSLWLAGSGRAAGWTVGLVAQALWLAYALVTAQYGFIGSALAYGAVFTRNLVRSRRLQQAEQ